MNVPDLPDDRLTEHLAGDDRFSPVPADSAYARSVADAVLQQECTLALFAASRDHWAKANTLTYDATRKAVEALLLTRGWRVRPVAGAHAAVGEVVALWLGHADDPGPRIAAKFAASRKARHEDEYPDPNSRLRHADELRVLAQDNVRLVNLVRASLGLGPDPAAVPTTTNVAHFDTGGR